MPDAVLYEKRGPMAFITLDRPPLNAYTTQMMRDLESIWVDCQEEPSVRAIVFSSAEGLPFGVGADMKVMFHGEELEKRTERPPRHQYLGEIKVWKPIVAAIDGYCLGGSMAMALGADLRVASETATFGLSMVKRGLFPAGATQWLPRMIPRAVALEMLLTGDRITAQRAYEIGLINKVVSPSELRPAALELAERICENSPVAVQSIKELSHLGLNEHFDKAVTLGWEMYTKSLSLDDVQEGQSAFRERRTPVFKDR